MAKVKQPYPEPRRVPWLDDRMIAPGEVVAVPDDQLPSWLEAGWIPADARTRAAGRKLLADKVITVLADDTAAPAVEPDGSGMEGGGS